MEQLSLLRKPSQENFNLPDAQIRLIRGHYTHAEADALLNHFLRATAWRQDTLVLYGKEHPLPRLTQWYGDGAYKYSGIRMVPEPWTQALLLVKSEAESASDARFNSVLLNYYRDGSDTVGWHADDEPELGLKPVIASVSLGATRDFMLRHNTKNLKTTIPLEHGSLLLMTGSTQANWQHSLPRRVNVGPRVNLTFRWVGAR